MRPLEQDPAWQQLASHHRRLVECRIDALFEADPERFERFSRRENGLLVDFSKNRLDAAALDALLALARARDVPARRDAMFAGDVVNPTEERAALHAALRTPEIADHAGVSRTVSDCLGQMEAFAAGVRDGTVTGVDGHVFTDVIHIGIGGSDLGPRLLADVVLSPENDGPRLHFVSSADAQALRTVLAGLDPATTLVVVATKSGGTRETLLNAGTALSWFAARLGRDAALAHHFVGVTGNPERLADAGLEVGRSFPLWDWVGGRYSVWSAVSVSVMMAAGTAVFREFLAGGAAMDRHFRDMPLADNLPVLLALVNVWNTTVLGAASQVVLPYDWRLRRLPAYLQQAVMESNGKSVTVDGTPAGTGTAAVLWGRSAIDGQHAFYQFLHQGTQVVPAEFICAMEDGRDAPAHRRELLANCLAQSRALMCGVDAESLAAEEAMAALAPERRRLLLAHRTHVGDRPSNTLLMRRADAGHLGRLVALYEHRIFVEATIWGINPFDQWGVELGKRLAGDLRACLGSDAVRQDLDGSTAGLVAWLRGGDG
ncbi:Glucose-6-phosphate isomerase [wastewater metagenome]|uniref:glucose-6-phosphate isomerase n=2 Tax=unclassified sequences TaxID=12908 RepID=A0A5B8RKA7_9ZZZZ|nr:glucose-6-phosphate isomerase [Arhodomonas sp. KWT]QEA07327.1 glucose-6-phosphate isomerase [uncultured organism]